MTVTVNCALGATSIEARMRPFLSSRLRAPASLAAAVGQLAPLRASKSGSLELLLNSAWVAAALIDWPWLNWWQVAQLRPLVPNGWKKARRDSSVVPAVLK